MVEAVAKHFKPDVRICVTIMNGKTDLLKLNPRYKNGYDDLTEFLIDDEKIAVQGAKDLGVTFFNQHRDVDAA